MSEVRSVAVTWGDATQTCINWSFQGKWTGSDYFESLVQLWSLMDSKRESLNLLVDMQHSRANPSNLVALMQAAVRKQPSCNVRRIVVVAAMLVVVVSGFRLRARERATARLAEALAKAVSRTSRSA